MVEIRTWLNSQVKSYDDGVKLFLQYGHDPALKSLFTLEQESDFKRRRLIQALQELIAPSVGDDQDGQHETDNLLPPQAIRGDFSQWHKGWPNPIIDRVIQALYDQWRPLYAELVSAQQRIYEVALQAENGNTAKALEACQLAHRIMDLDNECDDLYLQRDYYLEQGHLPVKEKPKDVVGDPVRWATERQNALRYVREFKAKIKNEPTSKLVPKWEQKLIDWQNEVTRLNKLLKLDD